MPADFKNNAEMEEIHFPVHTATLENHPGNVQKASMYHLASFVIDCIIKKSSKEKEINDLLIIANGLNFFKPKSCTSFSLIKDNIDGNDYKKTIINSLRAIEAHVGDQVEETRQVCFRYTIVVCRFFFFLEIMDFGLAAAVKSRNSPDIFRASLFLSKIPVNEALKSMGSTVSTSTICRRYTRFQYAPTIKRNIQRDGKAGALMTAYLSSCSANAQR